MRDILPKNLNVMEYRIVNMDSKVREGTHWKAHIKDRQEITYFNNYGNL